MTRSQLITKVANDTGISAVEVEKIMDGIFGTIGDVLKAGDKVTIAGFGRFEMRDQFFGAAVYAESAERGNCPDGCPAGRGK